MTTLVDEWATTLVGDTTARAGELGEVAHVNPATGKQQAVVGLAGPETVDAAVTAARKGARQWGRMPANERRNALLRVADLLEARGVELGALGVAENGTPTSFASLACGTFPAEYFRYFAGWSEKITGSVVPVYPHPALDYVVHEPYGVVGAIVPWNGPLGLIGMKLPAALVAGNAVIIKTSELAPFTAYQLGRICLEAGLPPGTVNVITGDARAGQAMVEHPGIDKISFTGGTATGSRVMSQAALGLKPLSLELGGKSAALVFDDADLDTAIATAVQTGIAMQSGQACMAPTRLLVQRSIYRDVVDEIVGLAEALEVGDPTDPGTLMGPLISAPHCERVLSIIDRARDSDTATLATGGNRIGGDLADGYFVEPTVFVDVDPSDHLAQTEVFGPVLSMLPFDTEAQAIEIANATPFGLAGFVYTHDLRRAHRVAAGLQAGYIGVNTFPLLPPNAPFGGYKQSGFGRELGAEGVHEFLRTKNVYVSLED
jgi:acyl-CoA reductase-like NAD-dependent aldehyde dehydrogenase